ncbi:DUF3047 domain-containing protein [Brevirhabdus sp.]|uniref:DUF3047 domain-containing protein n=1 Tax=Brevirhabdus sp. TaxID=2004514 RepID=UPI00405A1FB4
MQFRKFRGAGLIMAMLGLASAAQSMPLPFSDGWMTQRLSLFSHNKFDFSGNTLGIASDDAVSLVYTRLPRADWQASRASWSWAVTQSVPATDLTRKGGDDRNVALYFVFLPAAEAEALGPRASVGALLKNDNAGGLVFVWGGSGPEGRLVKSPYLKARGATVIQRAAGTGAFDESVDLSADYKRAFGSARQQLVGIAVSADSDDTNSAVRASLSDLRLK